MPKSEPSIVEFLAWIRKLDDSYKIFLFSLLSAFFLFVTLSTGQSIDPDSINELIVGAFVKSLGNESLILIWAYLARPILFVGGILQILISLYAIYKFGLIGMIVSSTGFVGLFLLLLSASFNLPQPLVYISLALIIFSYLLARWKSNLQFDDEGRVIMK